jgi:hypothetical protein
MNIWWPRVISNEKLWEMTGQININKEILQWNPQGTRGRGRERNSWRQTTLNESGKHSWSDVRFIARSQEGWRRFLDNLYS